jgi:hypothetical protein
MSNTGVRALLSSTAAIAAGVFGKEASRGES